MINVISISHGSCRRMRMPFSCSAASREKRIRLPVYTFPDFLIICLQIKVLPPEMIKFRLCTIKIIPVFLQRRDIQTGLSCYDPEGVSLRFRPPETLSAICNFLQVKIIRYSYDHNVPSSNPFFVTVSRICQYLRQRL